MSIKEKEKKSICDYQCSAKNWLCLCLLDAACVSSLCQPWSLPSLQSIAATFLLRWESFYLHLSFLWSKQLQSHSALLHTHHRLLLVLLPYCAFTKSHLIADTHLPIHTIVSRKPTGHTHKHTNTQTQPSTLHIYSLQHKAPCQPLLCHGLCAFNTEDASGMTCFATAPVRLNI